MNYTNKEIVLSQKRKILIALMKIFKESSILKGLKFKQ